MLAREDALDTVPENERPGLTHLMERRVAQVERFRALRPRFREVVEAMGGPPEWFVVGEWKRLLAKLDERWRPFPPLGFLRAPEML